MTSTLKFHRLHDDVRLPTRATVQEIGYDIYTYYKTETGRPNKVLIPPRAVRAVPTGLSIIAPPGFAVSLCTRAGMALSRSLFIINSPAILDRDYNGEVFVYLYNGGHEAQYIQHEERLCQVVLFPWTYFDMIEPNPQPEKVLQ